MKTAFRLSLVCALLIPLSAPQAKVFKADRKIDRALEKIASCEVISLPKCLPLKRLVDRGAKTVPYLAQVLQLSSTANTRKAAAHTLQYFPQQEGVIALAEQLSNERDTAVRLAVKKSLEVRGNGPLLRAARSLYQETDPARRVMASNLLGILHVAGGGQELVAASKDSIPRVQYAALAAMGKTPASDEVNAAIFHILGDASASWTLHYKAITAAGDLNLTETAPLIALSLSSTEHELQKQAGTVLGKFQASWAIPALVEQLKSPATAGAAALSLAEMGQSESSRAMLNSLQIDGLQQAEKFQVLWALGSLRAEDSVPSLVAMLQPGDEVLVYHVAQALGRIGSKDSTLPLILAMKNDNSQIRDIALWSLEQITGERLGFDNQVWLDWYKKNNPPAPL